MDFTLSDEQKMLSESLSRYGAEADPKAAEATFTALCEMGIFALMLPEEAGGLNGSAADRMVTAETLGRSLIGAPAMAQLLGAELLARAGRSAQAAAAAEGSLRVALSVLASDPDPQSPLILRGAADGDLALCITPGGVALADLKTLPEGAERLPQIDGTSALLLPQAQALTRETLNLDPQAALCCLRLGFGAEVLGLMERLLSDTLDYVKTRRQFGTEIGRFQTIQHRMARLYVGINQGRSALLAATLAVPDLSAGVWQMLVRQGRHTAHEAVQFHGGMGITDELLVSSAHKRLIAVTALPL